MDSARPPDYAAILQACFPQISIKTTRAIESGWDSFLLEVNGEYIFRFPRRPEIGGHLLKEIALLPKISKVLPVAVPRFEFVWTGGNAFPLPFVGYRKIPGLPLSAALFQGSQRDVLLRQLSETLTALHRFPVDTSRELSVPVQTPREWRDEYIGFSAWIARDAFPLLDASARDRVAEAIHAFLEDPLNFRFEPVLVHRDLGGEHILFDESRGRIAGIVDWGDASVGDPAIDFTGLLMDFGADVAQAVLSRYGGAVDSAFRNRTAFYATVAPFYGILFGRMWGKEEWVKEGIYLLQNTFSW